MQHFTCLIMAFGLIIGSGSFSKAVDIIALDNTNALADTPITNVGSITTFSWNAKVFTVGSQNAVMKQLVLSLYNTTAATETINFSLYNVDGSNNPTGTALASYSEAKTFTTSSSYYTFTTTMGNFVMQSGTKYALVVNSSSSTTAMSWSTVGTALGSIYTADTASGWSFDANRRTTNSGASWTSNTFYNGLQMTVTTAAVPEPSTYALAAIGTCFLGLMAKRRQKKSV